MLRCQRLPVVKIDAPRVTQNGFALFLIKKRAVPESWDFLLKLAQTVRKRGRRVLSDWRLRMAVVFRRTLDPKCADVAAVVYSSPVPVEAFGASWEATACSG